jgi:nucleotide-binding universal stress UspA family protein
MAAVKHFDFDALDQAIAEGQEMTSRTRAPPAANAMKTILACIDFSEMEGPVIEAAAALASAFVGELHVLHVAEPDPAFVGYAAGPETVRDRVASLIREEHRRVEACAEELTKRGLAAHPHLLRGPYAATILREAERLGAEVIVIGSHGHGRLHELLVGSVAEQVLRGAKVPVLVVPSRKNAATTP